MNAISPRTRNAGQDPSQDRWRPFCYRCWRTRILCLCNHVKVVENPVEILFLQHPNERTMPFNTARLAHLSLSRSRLVHGLRFDETKVVQDLLRRKERAGILFPSTSSKDLAQAPADLETLVVIDGTDPEQVKWFAASEYDKRLDVTLLLSEGNFGTVSKRISRPLFYADSKMIERLKLKAVPSVIKQKGRLMEVTEVALPVGKAKAASKSSQDKKGAQ